MGVQVTSRMLRSKLQFFAIPDVPPISYVIAFVQTADDMKGTTVANASHAILRFIKP